MALARVLLLVLVAGPAYAGGVFSRSDDTVPRAPEQYAERQGIRIDASVGGTYLAGNVEHLALRARLGLYVRVTDRHELFLEGAGNYSAFDSNPVIDKETASLLYAIGVHENVNLFFYTTHSHNRFLELDYRTTNSLGVCVHSFLGDAVDTVLVSLGGTPEHEWFSDGTRSSAIRATLRSKVETALNDYVTIGLDAALAPSIVEPDDFRANGEVYIDVKLTAKLLSLRITASDEYDARPRPGIEANDISIIPAIVVHPAP